ncbi:SET domain-containing protein SmydA-8-like isoform X2 [Plodia interpunctella]|uniref:SET domain-containing protein SmydA-8-like isoform X2 n=1 Tax=Plodia interpunctella TaxID=58824 RepID=UPI0023681994|nr:SET domain-containing protein SmydA-8-like isoform X2 [Plodia interpunctella]
MAAKYEIRSNDTLGRYLVAVKDLRAGEKIFMDTPFVLGPNSDTSLVCYNCYLPLINKFLVCKQCAMAPLCGEGCPQPLTYNWHSKSECEFFRTLKLTKGLSPMVMVQNVGSLIVLRALLKKTTDPQTWQEFMQLETHLEERKNSSVWEFYENTVTFIESLGLLEDIPDKNIVQKICAAIDVNCFDVRGPQIPGIGCSEILRGVYLQAALLAHDCAGNTHMAINDNNLLVCHASSDIKKGETIYYNYTDPLKGTALRQQHLLIGKYFKCTCERCADATELGTFVSSAICPTCKTGYLSTTDGGEWTCNDCKKDFAQEIIGHRIQCCADKLDFINKKDEKELEEYIRNVSLVLAPNHYLLLDAKQRLAGVLRDVINREPHPTKKVMRRKIQLCNELLPIIEKLTPGISRTKAITMYELHATMVQLAKKLFDSREISGSGYMDELLLAEKYLKRALEMLFIEPGNSPEGELCAKALEEYRALKATMNSVLDGLHEVGKTYVSEVAEEAAETNIN